MRYFVDVRRNEIVKEEDLNKCLPPEVYYEYCCGVDDNLIYETWRFWRDNKEMCLDFTYPSKDIDDKHLYHMRKVHFEKNGVNYCEAVLKRYIVPKYIYERAIKKYNLNK